MRVKITLQAIQPQKIQINYNYYLSSLIYSVLSKSDVDFSSKLHAQGYILGNRNFKLFCFSRLFPNDYSIEKDKLIVRDKIEWYISSPIKEFIFHLADGLLRQEKMRIGEGEFYVHSTEMLRSPEFTNKMCFRALSPIVSNTVEIGEGERKTVPCHISDAKFVENIKNNLIRKYFLIHGTLPENMSLEVAIDEKYLNNKGKLIQYKDTFIKGYQVPLELKGDPELIKVAYEAGVGEKNSAGFGLIEVDRR